MSTTFRLSCCTLLFVWFFLLFSFFDARSRRSPPTPAAPACPAGVARFYVYDLPRKFNVALPSRCRALHPATDTCPDVSNAGLGRPIPLHPTAEKHNRSQGSWYATHHSLAELIFHQRSLRHPCRTLDQDEAKLFYVPFYGGLDVSVQQGVADFDDRHRLTVELTQYVAAQNPWRRNGGRDHFLVLGRPAWDFMACDYYGFNRLLGLPEVENMSVLTVERVPPSGPNIQFELRYPTYFSTANQFAIPYPSYFHPRGAQEVAAWQEVVRRARRTHLFAFVGGRKEGVELAMLRGTIFRECEGGERWCRLVNCDHIHGGAAGCRDPEKVLEAMMGADFCLQPPGDWFTRRSVFDAVLAGCVPVFFSELTAQLQYGWYLPSDAGEYSVFLGGDPRQIRVTEELAAIPKWKVSALRRRVIELIPRVTYAHPDAVGAGFADAVDVALAWLSDHVRTELRAAGGGRRRAPARTRAK